MKFRKHSALLVGALLAAGWAHAGGVKTDDNAQYRPTGKGQGELDNSPGAAQRAAFARASTSNNGIVYHGGPLLNDVNGTNLYFIWYGNWSGNSAGTILPDWANHIGGSPYFNINTSYYDGASKHVTNKVNFLQTTTDNYSQGTALTDAQIQQVVSDAITSGRLPTDTNAVYMVLTSSDVNATSGFCTQYCGWHTNGSINGKSIKYAFIGNPDRCPSACSAQSTSPNANAGADGMVSIMSHELEEAVTDPQLNAWYDRRGAENADKCAWKFGTEYTTSNGAKANMKLGTRDYLIQQNWVNAGGGLCALSY